MRIVLTILSLAILCATAALLWPASQQAKPSESTEIYEITEPATSHMPVASKERNNNGGMNKPIEVDGRYTILGSGTEIDPYLLTWELLQSAMETMDLNGPRSTVPGRLAMLNGSHVQISGYLAPPLWGRETSELLVMLNRWDGCCIGLPPTPFDCIEARLWAPMKLGGAHSINFGTIRGTFIVEPFKAGAFLLGLYRLEDAKTDQTQPR